MKINLCPSEIVKMCLWDNYVYYIVGSEKEAEKILRENKEMEISERDALVVGILKVIETPNLIHKFNTYIVEFLTNKSIKDKDHLLVRKKTFDVAIDKFIDKFPDYWTKNSAWEKSLKELIEYVDGIKVLVDKLEIHEIIDKNITYEFYNSNVIRKLLKFQY